MDKNLKAARQEAEALTLEMSNMKSGQYLCERDEDANLIVTFNDGYQVQLPMIKFRLYQIEMQITLFIKKILRILLERPRRSGKEVETWNMIIEGAVESSGLYIMVYPTNVRARAVLWDGAILYEGNSLKFLDMIPKRLIANINNQDMKIKLINGSVIWILGSDI